MTGRLKWLLLARAGGSDGKQEAAVGGSVVRVVRREYLVAGTRTKGEDGL